MNDSDNKMKRPVTQKYQHQSYAKHFDFQSTQQKSTSLLSTLLGPSVHSVLYSVGCLKCMARPHQETLCSDHGSDGEHRKQRALVQQQFVFDMRCDTRAWYSGLVIESKSPFISGRINPCRKPRLRSQMITWFLFPRENSLALNCTKG